MNLQEIHKQTPWRNVYFPRKIIHAKILNFNQPREYIHAKIDFLKINLHENLSV